MNNDLMISKNVRCPKDSMKFSRFKKPDDTKFSQNFSNTVIFHFRTPAFIYVFLGIILLTLDFRGQTSSTLRHPQGRIFSTLGHPPNKT